ncbi:PREDICTED: proline-rich receptor-like protein kinase PERK9 [Haliaeetus leucocephalus]|uniref:proline-rich receptor-like protein kinase PERK9 n=1 Tax=Haliaeetus leucocephalus TaxID=52644 RepID=UPI00053CC48A|nr:PREDICTED: proline-rich receptor-like protein kinase PERK9 [Haliaeetus leucocephalus]
MLPSPAFVLTKKRYRIKYPDHQKRKRRTNNFISATVHPVPDLTRPSPPQTCCSRSPTEKLVTRPNPRIKAGPGGSPSPHRRAGHVKRYPRLPHRPPPPRCGPPRQDTSSPPQPDAGQEAEHPPPARGLGQETRSRPAPCLTERTGTARPLPGLPSPSAAQAPSAPPGTRQRLTHPPPPPALAGPRSPLLSAPHPPPSPPSSSGAGTRARESRPSPGGPLGATFPRTRPECASAIIPPRSALAPRPRPRQPPSPPRPSRQLPGGLPTPLRQ